MHTIAVKGTTIARDHGYIMTEYSAGSSCHESYYVIKKDGETIKQFYADPKKNHREARKTFTEEARAIENK